MLEAKRAFNSGFIIATLNAQAVKYIQTKLVYINKTANGPKYVLRRKP